MRFRTQYDANYKAEIFFTDPGDDPGQVQQNMRDECDVNIIMSRYQSTGELTHIREAVQQYGDFSDVTDFQTALAQIAEAESSFMELPAKIRDRFNNDPAQFIEFATNKDNQDELRELGLAPPLPKPPEPTIVKVVTEEPDAKADGKKPA